MSSANKQENTAGTARKPKPPKKINLAEIENIRLGIPPGTLPPGVVVVAVLSETGNLVGYCQLNELPDLKPIGDLSRLQGIPKLINSPDTLSNRGKQADIVKVVSHRVTKKNNLTPNFGSSGPKAVADALGLTQNLHLNTEAVKANVCVDEWSVHCKETLLAEAGKASKILEDYIGYCSSSGGKKKTLKEFCFEQKMSFWMFNHLTTKGWIAPDPQGSLVGHLFPKNSARSFALKVSELKEFGGSYAHLLSKSKLLIDIVKHIDILLQSDKEERGSRMEEILENYYVPMISPVQFGEACRLNRSAAFGIPKRDNELSPLQAVIANIHRAACGERPRYLTALTYWKEIANFDIDRRSHELPKAQFVAEHKDGGEEETPIDLILRCPEEASKSFLWAVTLGMPEGDPRLKEIMASILPKVSEGGKPPPKDAAAPAAPKSAPKEPKDLPIPGKIIFGAYYQELYDLVKVDHEVDRARRTVKLVLAPDEQEALSDPRLKLPEIKQKERRFPIGNAASQAAMRLLAGIRPKENPDDDGFFTGLYHVLTELFSSFNHPAVTERAVAIVRAQMVRSYGEGTFFSTDSLTGQGAEVFDAVEDDDFF